MAGKAAAVQSDGGLSGGFAVRHRELIRERFGEATLTAALAALSSTQRDVLRDASPLGWVPISAMQALYDALGRVTGRTAADLHFEIGALASEQTIRTVWRIVMRMTTDSMLVSRVPVLYPKTFDRGRLSARLVRPGCAEASLDDWPDAPDYVLRGLHIAVATTLRLAGRGDVNVRIERTANGAVLRASWRS